MEYGIVYLLILVRIVCLVVTAPILGGSAVPLKIRLGLALFVATAVFPLLLPSLESETGLNGLDFQPAAASVFAGDLTGPPVRERELLEWMSRLFPLVMAEIIIGTSLGLGIALLVLAARSAGAMIGQLAGLQWAASSEGGAEEGVSVVGQIYGIVAAATFVAMGGMEIMIGGLLESYTSLPIGLKLESRQVVDLATEFLQHSFSLTLRGIVPVVAAMLTSTLTVGFISRAYPQLNVLSLSLSLNQLILFLLITLTLGSCVWLLVGDLEGFVHSFQSRFQQMQPGDFQ